jgi:transcriptional regulator with XRE-family HTH domain
MSGEPLPEVDVRHYAAVLRQAIRAAGLSVTEVERRLGVGPKSLRRVFGGQVDLKFKHLVAVLRVIGMSHEEFFTFALRRRRRWRRSRGGEFLAAFRDAGASGEFRPVPEELERFDKLSEEEFNREVEESVDRLLKRRAEEGKPLLFEGVDPEIGELEEPPPGELEEPPAAQEEGRKREGDPGDEGDPAGGGGEPE